MQPILTQEPSLGTRMRTFGSQFGVVAIIASLAAPSVVTGQRAEDYSLAVVSALLPSPKAGETSDVVTLVIENRGTASAPASLVSVAPRNHLSLARTSTIPQLVPGQRATVQLPVEIGPDGTPCISITITAIPSVDPAIARFLAAVIPDPQIGTPAWVDLASIDSRPGFTPFGGISRSQDLAGLSDW